MIFFHPFFVIESRSPKGQVKPGASMKSLDQRHQPMICMKKLPGASDGKSVR